MTISAPLMEVFAAEAAGVPLGQPALGLVAVPLYRIVPCRWQPRQVFDQGALLELALDIEQHGVLTPPLVWQNEDMEYELIAGERRIRACYALCLRHIRQATNLQDAIERVAKNGFARDRANYGQLIDTSGHPQATVQCREVWGKVGQLHELALVDNLQRQDLTALEEAHALHDLITEYAYTQRDLARRLGKSQTWISQRLNLLDLAPAVADQVAGGELDSATAREIARLDPAVQGEVVAHLHAHGIKSKAAANLVGNILELSEPQAWPSDGGNYHSYNVLIQSRLEDAAPVDRQRSMLALAIQNNDGRLARPQDSYHYDRVLVAVGGAAAPYQAIQKAFATNAAGMGRTCETCQLNARRPQISEVQELSRAAKNRDQTELVCWPQCGMGETHSCPSHRTADERISLHVPRDYRIELAPEEEAHIAKLHDWYQTTDDFDVWYSVCCRKFRYEIATEDRRKDEKENGLARALAGYIAEQEKIATDHVYSQPCANCGFHKRDAEDSLESCQHQQQPPELEWGQDVLAATWQADGEAGLPNLVGRCLLFRLRQIGLLPDLPGKVDLRPPAMLMLLYRLSDPSNYSGNTRSGPRWLDVARSHATHAPAWSACEPVLKKLLPLLVPGQLYALLAAWNDVLPPDSANAQQIVFDPHLNRDVTFRRVSQFKAPR
jgi:ParB family chromosome partitioning protein